MAAVMVLGCAGAVSADEGGTVEKTKVVESATFTNYVGWYMDESGSADATALWALSTDCTWTYTITPNDGYNNTDFFFEIYDASGRYITMSTDTEPNNDTNNNVWFFGCEGTFEGSLESFDPSDQTYTITVVRDGQDFTITVVDAGGSDVYTVTAKNTNMDEAIAVHVLMQWGQAEISGSLTYTAPVGYEGYTWWNAQNEYLEKEVSGNGTWICTIKPVKLVNNGGVFTVEAYDASGNWETTTSELVGWPTGNGGTESHEGEGSVTWSTDSVFTIVISRNGSTFTFDYYEDGEYLETETFTGSGIATDITLKATAQSGIFDISIEEVESVSTFLGGSLRMSDYDEYGYDSTSLRFGYTITLPEGVTEVSDLSWKWDWGTAEDGDVENVNLSRTLAPESPNYVDNDDGTITSNLVITEIPSSDYNVTICSRLTVEYTIDGKTYTSVGSVDSRTVYGVAEAVEQTSDSDREITYVTGILGTRN